MFCVKCGNELQEGQNFCTKCGNKVSWPVNETPGMYDSPVWETETRAETPDENHVREDHVPDGGMEYSAFDRVAIKTGNILEITVCVLHRYHAVNYCMSVDITKIHCVLQ